MFTIKDNGDGSADLFHDGEKIGTVEHDRTDYQVGDGKAHGHSRYVVRGVSVTDSDLPWNGNEALVTMASGDHVATQANIKGLLQSMRDRYVADQLRLTRECLADGRNSLDEVVRYANSLATRYETGVTDFRPLEDGLRAIIREERRKAHLAEVQ